MFIPVTSNEHTETVARLARAIWSEHYFPIIGKKQTEYMLEQFQTVDAIARQIARENYRYFLMIPEKEAFGYLAVQPRTDHLFLSKIYVSHTVRRQGLGRAAVTYTEQLAIELNKSVITLTVNRHNTTSIAAYSRCGFRIVDQVVTDIGGGFVMDDYVMQKNVTADQTSSAAT